MIPKALAYKILKVICYKCRATSKYGANKCRACGSSSVRVTKGAKTLLTK